MRLRTLALGLTALMFALPAASAQSTAPNQVVGTWRMISAQVDPDGQNIAAYGVNPNALLVFTPDMHFIEVLTDGDTPRFASDDRGKGTDAENREAMARNIAFFGTYTVDEKGQFSGNRVTGSTFPNWVGSVRTRQQLNMTVNGDRMTENFLRPEGPRIVIEWQRVK